MQPWKDWANAIWYFTQNAKQVIQNRPDGIGFSDTELPRFAALHRQCLCYLLTLSQWKHWWLSRIMNACTFTCWRHVPVLSAITVPRRHRIGAEDFCCWSLTFHHLLLSEMTNTKEPVSFRMTSLVGDHDHVTLSASGCVTLNNVNWLNVSCIRRRRVSIIQWTSMQWLCLVTDNDGYDTR